MGNGHVTCVSDDVVCRGEITWKIFLRRKKIDHICLSVCLYAKRHVVKPNKNFTCFHAYSTFYCSEQRGNNGKGMIGSAVPYELYRYMLYYSLFFDLSLPKVLPKD